MVRRISTRGVTPIWLLGLVASTIPLACGDDGSGAPNGAGGSAGKGGKGGGAGTSGSSGVSGRGGHASAAGGTAGSGASGGDGHAGGTAVGGGSGAAGKGGSGSGGGHHGGSGGVSSGSGGSGAGEGGAAGQPGGAAGEAGGASGGNGGAECASAVAFSAEERSVIATLGELGAVPADTTNAFADNAAAAALGQRFFFDKSFSGPLAVASDLGNAGESGKIACASCHGSAAMSDDRSVPNNVSLGANFHSRNAPGLVDSAFYPWTNWGGRFSRQWELPMPVSESGVIMNFTRLGVAHVIFDKYKSDYEAVFTAYPLDAAIGTDNTRFPAAGKPKANASDPDGAWEGMTDADRASVNRIFVNYAKAITAYVRKLVSRHAPFDRFVAGDDCAISDQAKLGLKLFVGQAGCTHCHSGSGLSDGGFHNIGVAQTGDHVPASDDGRFKDLPPLLASSLNAASATFSDDPSAGAAKLAGLSTTDEANRAAFRTPSLRGVADSAPYMHAGQLATLADVVDFYDRGGDTPSAGTKDVAMQALNLSAEQKSELVSFLLTLTGEPVPSDLRADTSK